jgi:hypothetical protein
MVAHPDEAADALAIMHHIAAAGLDGLDAHDRDGFGMVKPYCHQAAGWGLFFEAVGPRRGPCTVTVILLADFSQKTITAAQAEAATRLVLERGR